MLQGFPTKHGTGISIYGDYCDLRSLYLTIHRLTYRSTEDPSHPHNAVLMNFAHEIRKAYSENRLKEKLTFDQEHQIEYLGVRYLWTDLLITLSVLRHVAGFVTTMEVDQANLYLLDYITKQALNAYDPKGANILKEFIGQRIQINDPLLMQINAFINMDYLKTKPTKTRFRNLHRYFIIYFSPWTEEYKKFKQLLQTNATQLGCTPEELSFDAKEFPEEIAW